MALYIGKNKEKIDPVQSVFRLAGKDEDALTYALGFLLSQDSDFCTHFIRKLKVAKHKRLSPNYSIRLQEFTQKEFGRRDVTIETEKVRIVIEAKIRGAEPTVEQLVQYGEEEGHLERT